MNQQAAVPLSVETAGEIAQQLRGYVHRLESQLRGVHQPDERRELQEIISSVRANIVYLQIRRNGP